MVVKTEKIDKKTKKPAVTKDGEQIIEYRFEVGDLFIPQYNSLIKKTNIAKVDGVQKTIVNYTLNCIVKDFNNNEPIFVSLTPSQARSLNKKIANDVILNQHLFIAYSYTDVDGNDWVGVGIKNEQAKPKTFTDFETELNQG